MAKLPTVTSNLPRDLRTFLDRVREAMDGSGPDSLVSARQLVAAGIASYSGTNLAPVAEGAYSTPARPKNVEASGALANIMVTWDKPVYLGHSYAEIWAASQTEEQEAADEAPTIGQAELVGMSPGVFFAHNIGAGGKRWYWVRFINIVGDAGPYQGTEGIAGETSLDPEYMLEVLTGALTQTQLYSPLSTKIDRIDGKTRLFYQADEPTGTDDFPLAVGDIWIQSTLTYAPDYTEGEDYEIRSNRMYRWDGSDWVEAMDYGLRDFFTALNTEKTERVSEDEALASTITTVQAGLGAQIQQEQTARISENSSLAEQITTLTATVNSNNTSLSARISTEENARVDGDGAVAGRVTDLEAVVADNYTAALAAISEEATTRADELGALASTVTTIQADYITSTDQTSAINAAIQIEQGARASAVEAVAEDLTTLEAELGGDISNALAQLQVERETRAEADLAVAGQVTSLAAQVDSDITAAVQVEAEARASAVEGIESKYSVKVDNAGHVAGFGLISTGNVENIESKFGINADAFWLAPPATVSNSAPTSNLYAGRVWVDTSGSGDPVTKYYTGSSWSTNPQNLPFVVRTSPTTINGESVPAGVYMADGYIQNGTITNAKIGNATIDKAKIASVDAGTITAGFLDANRIEAGSIDADKIDSRGLSIKDLAGNVVLAAGTPLKTEFIDYDGINSVGLFWNSNLTIVAPDGRPAGCFASYSNSTKNTISYADAAKTVLKIQTTGTDTQIGCAFTAFRVDPTVTYKFIVRAKSNAAYDSGFYIRANELDSELDSGVQFVGQSTKEAGGQTYTRTKNIGWDNSSITASYNDYVLDYVPTSTAKWASLQILNWTGMGDDAVFVDRIAIVPAQTQITADNASTYIADAAIDLAQIKVASIDNLESLSANMGTITAGKMQSQDGNFVIDLDNKTISIET
jgi:hypothetical protein